MEENEFSRPMGATTMPPPPSFGAEKEVRNPPSVQDRARAALADLRTIDITDDQSVIDLLANHICAANLGAKFARGTRGGEIAARMIYLEHDSLVCIKHADGKSAGILVRSHHHATNGGLQDIRGHVASLIDRAIAEAVETNRQANVKANADLRKMVEELTKERDGLRGENTKLVEMANHVAERSKAVNHGIDPDYAHRLAQHENKPKIPGREIAELFIRPGRGSNDIAISGGITEEYKAVYVDALFGSRDSVLESLRVYVARMIDSARADASFSFADQAYEMLGRLIAKHEPQFKLMPQLYGVCGQIENLVDRLTRNRDEWAARAGTIAGEAKELRDRLYAQDKELERLRGQRDRMAKMCHDPEDVKHLREKSAVLSTELGLCIGMLEQLAGCRERLDPESDHCIMLMVTEKILADARLRAAYGRVVLLQ